MDKYFCTSANCQEIQSKIETLKFKYNASKTRSGAEQWNKAVDEFMTKTVPDLEKLLDHAANLYKPASGSEDTKLVTGGTHSGAMKRNASEEETGKAIKLSYESRIEELEKESEHNKTELRHLSDLVKSLIEERDGLQKRLSEEWTTKVGKDESSLENVNIKNRPMKVAEEYDCVLSASWLSAKVVLDELDKADKEQLEKLTVPIPTEEQRVAALRKVMMDAEKIAKMKYKKLSNAMYELITIQVEQGVAAFPKAMSNKIVMVGKGSQLPKEETEVEATFDKIPDGLKNAIGDFLRVTSDTTDISGILEEIKFDLMASAGQTVTKEPTLVEMKKTCTLTRKMGKEIAKTIKASEDSIQEIDTFIKDCGRLAWKMVTQRPQMEFDISTGIDESWKGEKFQDVAYNSQNPRDPNNVVKYYVHPALMHSKAMMKTGRVFIGKKDDK